MNVYLTMRMPSESASEEEIRRESLPQDRYTVKSEPDRITITPNADGVGTCQYVVLCENGRLIAWFSLVERVADLGLGDSVNLPTAFTLTKD
jgi:hypothetical protein